MAEAAFECCEFSLLTQFAQHQRNPPAQALEIARGRAPSSPDRSATRTRTGAGAVIGALPTDGQIAHGDTFQNDRHPDLKIDYILANPPFSVGDWRSELLLQD